MIGQLRGILTEKQAPTLLLDVNGVGYLVHAPLSTFYVLPETGEQVTLRIHMIVREDAQLLYGFATKEEWSLFQDIIKVNGIGPKMALAILSSLSPHDFMHAIQTQSIDSLKRIPGIGAKTAQRIIVDMQDKKSMMFNEVALHVNATSAVQDAITALMALGYKPQEATQAVNKVDHENKHCEQILKEALQGLTRL